MTAFPMLAGKCKSVTGNLPEFLCRPLSQNAMEEVKSITATGRSGFLGRREWLSARSALPRACNRR